MTAIFGLLFSRVGAATAWVLVAALVIGCGWYYVQAQRIPGLQQDIVDLTTERNQYRALSEQKKVAVGAMEVQAQNCYKQFEAFRKSLVSGKVVRMDTKQQTAYQQPVLDEVNANDSNSTDYVGRFNSLFMWTPKDSGTTGD